MKIAYLDCFSGVSGDMLLGAVLDAGLTEADLRQTLEGLEVNGYELTVERRVVSGFAATRVIVDCPSPRYAHGDDHGYHHPEHRQLADIAAMLGRSALPEPIRLRSLAVFTRLAEAEATIHGTTMDQVQFHEVGAVDALVDIVGVVAGLHHLGVDRLICSPLPLSRGWITCAHGEIPLPAPAVCHLLEGAPVYGEAIDRELVTPTGAALVRTLAEGFGSLPPMVLEATGLGAGSMQRPDGRPNLLRLLIGRSMEVDEAQEVEVIETHLDDWNPEFWPHVSERLMTAGALDVCLIPMQMKKGRPGFLLRLIAEPAATHELTTLLFSETSAIGLRRRREQRQTLPREQIMVTTPWGDLPGKRILTPDGEVVTPEYEACRAVALAQGVPLHIVYSAVREGGRSQTRNT